MLSIGTFALMVGISVLGILFMAMRMHKESMNFVKELQFFLKHRTISHNQIKAKYAVLQSQFDQLRAKNDELENLLRKNKIEFGFDGALGEAKFLDQKKKLEELSPDII